MRGSAAALFLLGLVAVDTGIPATCHAEESVALGEGASVRSAGDRASGTATPGALQPGDAEEADPARTGSLSLPDPSIPQLYRNYRIGGPEG